MYKSEVKDQAVSINGTIVDGQSCLFFPGSEELKWDNTGAEVVYIKAGENAGQSIFGQVQSGKNVLVVADTSHQKTLARFRNFRMQRMAGSGSVVVVLYPGVVDQYKVRVSATLTGFEFANVVGIIRGKSKPDERVIFSAHYDHLGIGKPKDQDSIFHHYQKLIFLRKKHDIIAYGDYQEILGDHDELFAYIRSHEDEKLLVINNFYAKEASFEIPREADLSGFKSELLLSNYRDSKEHAGDFILRPYESCVYLLKRE